MNVCLQNFTLRANWLKVLFPVPNFCVWDSMGAAWAYYMLQSVHLLFGAVAILSSVGPIVTVKGSFRHKMSGRVFFLCFIVATSTFIVEGLAMRDLFFVAGAVMPLEPLIVGRLSLRLANKKRKERIDLGTFWPEIVLICATITLVTAALINSFINGSTNVIFIVGLYCPALMVVLWCFFQIFYFLILTPVLGHWRLFHASQMMASLVFAVMAIIFALGKNASFLGAAITMFSWQVLGLTAILTWFSVSIRKAKPFSAPPKSAPHDEKPLLTAN